MTLFYIYLHCRPDGTPFYVGKGTGRRAHRLILESRNPHHQNIVKKYGADNIEVLSFPRESEVHALADEIQWIKVLREAGYGLCNQTDGGDGSSGCSPSIETIAKRVAKIKGRKHSAEAIARMSASRIGKKRPPFSDEWLSNISVGLKGNKHLLGHKHSDESRAKMSAALKGKPNGRLGTKHSPETKAKMSASQKGNKNSLGCKHIRSAEYRAKQSASQLRRKK
jgi:hypothetical protein